MLKVATIFHMAGIFDSGWAEKILRCLKKQYQVLPVTYGTMGKTAVLDSFLENEIIVKEGKTSDFLAEISKEVDAVILAMYALTPKKSHAHCWHLINASKISKPVVEVEAKSGVVIPWTSNSKPLASFISGELGLVVIEPPIFSKPVWNSDGKKYRRILGVDVGDYVLINKVVVGKANSEEVILVEEDGFLRNIVGVDVKSGGFKRLTKMGAIDVEKVGVEATSSLRFTCKKPRIVNVTKKSGIAFIDHVGYNVYQLASEAEAAVTVGDDTSLVAGNILYRFQTPILGITDGDRDSLLEDLHITKNSLILTVSNDDEVGEKIHKEIFNKKLKIHKKFEDLKSEVLKLVRNEILNVTEIR